MDREDRPTRGYPHIAIEKRTELVMKTQMKSRIWFLPLLALLSAPHLASAYYDPGVQRWINRDPKGELGFEVLTQGYTSPLGDGPNPYRLVANDSLNRMDPYGLQGKCLYACARIMTFFRVFVCVLAESNDCDFCIPGFIAELDSKGYHVLEPVVLPCPCKRS
jgi:hypothetical protein